MLVDPDALALGLRMQRMEAETRLIPIRQQVTMLEEQIGKLRVQLERLLDLYLESEIEKEQWVPRRDRLSAKLASHIEQHDKLQRRLTEDHVTDEQIRGMRQFTREISLGIDAIEDNFEAKRHIVDTLDVQVTLGHNDDGDKAVYASCAIGPSELCIVSEDTRCCLCPMPKYAPWRGNHLLQMAQIAARLDRSPVCPSAMAEFYP